MFEGDVVARAVRAADHLGQETSLEVGRARPGRASAPGGYELAGQGRWRSSRRSHEYPITPKEHGVDFLMDHRHLWLRSTRQHAILRVRATIIKAIRDFFDERGFTLVDAPIFTPQRRARAPPRSSRPTTSTRRRTSRRPASSTSEAAATAFGKVYCFGPTFRAEKSKTRRHLAEFWMVEPEVAFIDLDDDMELAGATSSAYIVAARARARHGDELADRSSATPRSSRRSSRRSRASRTTRRSGSCKDGHGERASVWGDDFGGDEETVICRAVRSAGDRAPLPDDGEGVLHEARPGRPELALCASTCSRPRATARSSAAASARTTSSAARSASTSTSCRAKRSSGTSICAATARPARRLRPGHRAHRGLDLRPAPRPRDDPVRANAGSAIPVSGRAHARRSRARRRTGAPRADLRRKRALPTQLAQSSVMSRS